MTISAAIEVDRAPEEVFAYVTDPGRFSEWQHGVVGGHMDGNGSGGVGDLCHTRRKIGIGERDVTSEVTHVDPPRAWGVRGIDGPIRASVDVTVTPVEEGRRSRVEIGIDFTGHGIGKVLVPFVVIPEARREMPSNLKALKQRLES